MKRSAVQKRFGPYRFLPAFFALGGLLELFMIKVRIGKETFCKNFNVLFFICNKLFSSQKNIWFLSPDQP